jgi:hypothetical protein
MRARPVLLARWLHLALVCASLAAGTGLHGLLHASGAHGERPAASGQIEAHGGQCPHRSDVPDHAATHECLVCKLGGSLRDATHTARVAWLATASPSHTLHTTAHVVRSSIVAGVLGARAPPAIVA